MTTLKQKRINENIKKDFRRKRSFLHIDKVLEYKLGKKIVTQHYISGKEWFFENHFPGNPVMPGNIIAESMVHICSLLLDPAKEKKGRAVYLVSSKIRFFKVVKPKSRLTITTYPVRIFSQAAIFKAEAHVKNMLVARGEFTVAC